MVDTRFWDALQHLAQSGEIVIDRPAHSCHPRYPGAVYPFNYGYITGTHAGDGDELDVWCCAGDSRQVTGVVMTVDMDKHDTEIKLLLGCTPAQAHVIHTFHDAGHQSALLVLRATTDKEGN